MEGYDDKGDPLVQGVISATAVLTSAGDLTGPGGKPSRVQQIEAAMVAAITACGDEGITDPVVIKERMMANRQAVLDTPESN